MVNGKFQYFFLSFLKPSLNRIPPFYQPAACKNSLFVALFGLFQKSWRKIKFAFCMAEQETTINRDTNQTWKTFQDIKAKNIRDAKILSKIRALLLSSSNFDFSWNLIWMFYFKSYSVFIIRTNLQLCCIAPSACNKSLTPAPGNTISTPHHSHVLNSNFKKNFQKLSLLY